VVIFSVIVFVTIVALQMIIYLAQTGAPLVWSYGKEGFNFTSPEIFKVLFSYRKGLFVYSPVLLLAILGMMVGLSKGRRGFMGLMVFLMLVTWVISSWWMWYYGGSFGQRAFIEYLPFFAIGLAFVLENGWGFIRPWFFYIVSILFIAIQLIQTYQYKNNILPFDNLSKTKYWNLFLRTGEDLAWYYPGYEGEDSYEGTDSLLIYHDMETELGWGNENQFSTEDSHQGIRASKMRSTDQYGITYRKKISEINVETNVVRVSSWIKTKSRTTDLVFVCSVEDESGNGYFWKKYPVRPQLVGSNEWSWVTCLFKCGVPQDSTDKFVIYPMKSDETTVYVDDLEISFIKAE
jgi:hypothetical protein